jgi:hypothetical protein
MRAFSSVLSAICVLLPAAMLSAANLEFDGETYVKKDSNDTPEIRRVEYVRENETLDNWTRLITIRNFTALDNAKEAVLAFAERLKQDDPSSDPVTLISNDGETAIISFVVGPEDGSYGEFNVWRYAKVEGYPGLIACQFAYRFTGTTDEETDKFKEDILRWTKELAEADFDLDFGK